MRVYICRTRKRIDFNTNTKLGGVFGLVFFKAFNCLFLLQSLNMLVTFFFLKCLSKVVLKRGLCIMNYTWGLLVMYFHLTGDLVLQLIAMVA